MAQIVIRNLDDSVKEALRQLAASHGVSMEAEAREILTKALHPRRRPRIDFVRQIIEEEGAIELDLPERAELQRRVDLP